MFVLGGAVLAGCSAARSSTDPMLRATPGRGTTYGWGSERGMADTEIDAPVEQPALPGTARAIAATNSTDYALLSDGTVWAWGAGQEGQLGNGTTPVFAARPVEVRFPTGTRIVAIGEGGAQGDEEAIDSRGGAWVWGSDDRSSLCESGSPVTTPVRVTTLPPVKAASGGGNHSVWLTTDGHVLTCGSDWNGELGNGRYSAANFATPQPVRGLPAGDPVVAVSAGSNANGALTRSGALYTWGDNRFGQAGIGSRALRITQVQRVPGTFSSVSFGGNSPKDGQAVAITRLGTVEAWGDDHFGQLGDGSKTNEDRPVAVRVPPGVRFVAVVSGGDMSGAVDTRGDVWMWGDNSAGQLGDGRRGGSVGTPTEVDRGAVAIEAISHNVLVLHG
jgi:alpha-tubulin suppressor-like RCC1 family protein